MSALVLAGGLALGQEHGGKIDWLRDAQFGLMKARLEGKVAMLYFTATW
jgi:hypothetical protein